MIRIKDGIVYRDKVEIGTVRNFCCGVDYRPNRKPKALFSILKVRNSEAKLKECIDVIDSIKIPKKGHWNFHYEMVGDTKRLKKYEQSINE